MAADQMPEINIILFPPMGAGLTPQGQLVPSLTYPRVIGVEKEFGYPDRLSFTTRSGDRIVTTLPYVIHQVVPTPGAEA